MLLIACGEVMEATVVQFDMIAKIFVGRFFSLLCYPSEHRLLSASWLNLITSLVYDFCFLLCLSVWNAYWWIVLTISRVGCNCLVVALVVMHCTVFCNVYALLLCNCSYVWCSCGDIALGSYFIHCQCIAEKRKYELWCEGT